MKIGRLLRNSAIIAIWLVVLTFPIMVIRNNTITDTVDWRWSRLWFVGIGGFVVAFVWSFLLSRQKSGGRQSVNQDDESNTMTDRLLGRIGWSRDTLRQRKVAIPAIIVFGIALIAIPFFVKVYPINVMISVLIYIVLALGLNIVIGLGGMLHLGYAAFYCVGAYTYGLLNHYFGVGFWAALPIAGAVSLLFGVLLAIPLLRLRGDYLAIVTLAFGEIIRIVLLNWGKFSLGPSGINNISRPAFFGVDFSYRGTITFIYYIALALVLLTILVVYRLENSRIGRQLVAMGEDDVAAQAMGVNTAKAKLMAFGVGAVWAGLAGVVFATKTTLITPNSFRVWDSVIILCMVVLGGIKSIPGVIIGATLLVILPEVFRGFSDYRLLIFGATLVVMMVFRPDGLIPKRRRRYEFQTDGGPAEGDATGEAAGV
jgi:branched-chain amino acid transport system permease protein